MNDQDQAAPLSDLESSKVLRNTSLAFAIVALTLAVAEALKHSFGYLEVRVPLAQPTRWRRFWKPLFGWSLVMV
jgi:hypothetical protein